MINSFIENYKPYFEGVFPSEDDLSRLPAAKEYLKVGFHDVPLYGSILGGEIKAFNALVDLQKDSEVAYGKVLAATGADPRISTTDLKRALRLGEYQIEKFTPVKVTWTKIGQPEIAKIAADWNVTVFTSTINGEDSSLQDLIVERFTEWRELGYDQNSGLEMANAILAKEAPYKKELGELHQFDGTEVLTNAGMTWSSLNDIDVMLDPDLAYLMVIKFRTGVGHYNPLDYLPLADKVNVINKLKEEVSGVPTEPIVAENKNVDVEKSEGSTENLS